MVAQVSGSMAACIVTAWNLSYQYPATTDGLSFFHHNQLVCIADLNRVDHVNNQTLLEPKVEQTEITPAHTVSLPTLPSTQSIDFFESFTYAFEEDTHRDVKQFLCERIKITSPDTLTAVDTLIDPIISTVTTADWMTMLPINSIIRSHSTVIIMFINSIIRKSIPLASIRHDCLKKLAHIFNPAQ
jgi:hypothetical protein